MELTNIFYQDETAIIYNNDYREIIDNLEFNYIITDPPYNVNYKYIDYKDNLNSEDYINLLSPLNNFKSVLIHYHEALCGDVGEAMGRPEKIISWCYSSNLPRQQRAIAFYGLKPNLNLIKQPYKNLNDKRIKKRIEEGHEGARLYDWWDDIQLIKAGSEEKIKGFTNQIPIKLLERIILISTNKNDIILDPFFGSGSLYFACKNTNRRCIGIEQSEEHLKYFKSRLENEKTF